VAKTRRARRIRGTPLTVVLLVLASISIITLDYRGDAHGLISGLKRVAHEAFSPVQSGVDVVVHPIGDFLAGATNAGGLQQENARLRAQLGRLQGRAAQFQDEAARLRALEELVHLPYASGIPTVTGQVVGFNTSDFASTVTLDVGSSSGVAVGMPVVGGAGLAGQVIEAWSSGCTVRLVTDPRSAVGVRFGAQGSLALAQGAGSGQSLSIAYVAPGTQLHKGEVLTTSGLQQAQYPAGIPLGTVTSYSTSASATQETVSAKPIVDLDQLEYVDVLQWLPAS
jgi:rod shape-determining protein MreC